MSEIDFRRTSLEELARSVRAKEVSARELTEAALARIERLDPHYNAFVAVDGARALREAAVVDEAVVVCAGASPAASPSTCRAAWVS